MLLLHLCHSLLKQEMATIPEHLISFPVYRSSYVIVAFVSSIVETGNDNRSGALDFISGI